MKKTIALALLCGLTMGCFAAETIYRGASTNAKDCLLTYTGSFPSSRLLFMAIELAK